jgi:uncharacterized membrane protein SirB2
MSFALEAEFIAHIFVILFSLTFLDLKMFYNLIKSEPKSKSFTAICPSTLLLFAGREKGQRFSIKM